METDVQLTRNDFSSERDWCRYLSSSALVQAMDGDGTIGDGPSSPEDRKAMMEFPIVLEQIRARAELGADAIVLFYSKDWNPGVMADLLRDEGFRVRPAKGNAKFVALYPPDPDCWLVSW